MINLKNLKRYYKDGEPRTSIFLMSDDGQDWYESYDLFLDSTAKIMYNSDGIIVCASRDVTSLPPINCSVAELEYDGDVEELYGKFFDGTEVKDVVESEEEMKQRFENEISVLKHSALSELTNLKTAIDLSISTESDEKRVQDLKAYVLELNELTPSDFVEGFELPKKPQ